jgi:hypothetical protein
MVRNRWTVLGGALLAGLLLSLAGQGQTADAPAKPADKAVTKAPAGTWKFVLPMHPRKDSFLWLVQIEQKAGDWSGKLLATGEAAPRSRLMGVTFKDNILHFTLKAGQERIHFEGRVPTADVATIQGTITLGSGLTIARLERSTLEGLDSYALDRETVASSKDGVAVMQAVRRLLERAASRRAKADEVRGWVERGLKVAEPYGPPWQQEFLLQALEAMNEQDGMAAAALPFARKAETLLTAKSGPALRKRTLGVLATALERAGKADEAKEVSARAAKIDFSVVARPVPPRKGKNNRTVLVELFTGAECPPCVAQDLAFDALAKSFQPTEAILLQYHLHIPGPDPLTNTQTEARQRYYQEAFGRQVSGTPRLLLNGNPSGIDGGYREHAQSRYNEAANAILDQLDSFDKPARVNLTVEAKRKGDRVDITANVADLQDTGASVRLRLVLAEEEVKYRGGNGIGQHHCVVRDLPGGVAGQPLKEKSATKSVSVDLGDLRQSFKKHLQAKYKDADVELPKDIPMEMKNLRVIAIIQDDNTREVLHAVQVEVEEAK